MKRRSFIVSAALSIPGTTAVLTGVQDRTSRGDTAVSSVSEQQLGYTHEANPSSRVSVFQSEEATVENVRWDDVAGDLRDEVEKFIETTDFETSILILVEGAGPNSSYRNVHVEEVHVEEGILKVFVEVVQSDGPGAAEPVNAMALVRIEFEGEPTTNVELSLENGWGETVQLTESGADERVSILYLAGGLVVGGGIGYLLKDRFTGEG